MTDDEILEKAAADNGAQWRRWFAWRPIWLNNEHRFGWLIWVDRRDFELGWGVSVHQRRRINPQGEVPAALSHGEGRK